MRDDQTAKTVRFNRIRYSPGIWRASLADAEHIGGTGKTPEEAVGWMVLNHPSRFGVGAFVWLNRPPKLPHPEVSGYPEGIQEIYGAPLSEDQRRAVELVAGPDLDADEP